VNIQFSLSIYIYTCMTMYVNEVYKVEMKYFNLYKVFESSLFN